MSPLLRWRGGWVRRSAAIVGRAVVVAKLLDGDWTLLRRLCYHLQCTAVISSTASIGYMVEYAWNLLQFSFSKHTKAYSNRRTRALPGSVGSPPANTLLRSLNEARIRNGAGCKQTTRLKIKWASAQEFSQAVSSCSAVRIRICCHLFRLMLPLGAYFRFHDYERT